MLCLPGVEGNRKELVTAKVNGKVIKDSSEGKGRGTEFSLFFFVYSESAQQHSTMDSVVKMTDQLEENDKL